MLMEVYPASGRPTGATCEAPHEEYTHPEGRWWIGPGCSHHSSRWVEVASREEAHEAFLSGEHQFVGHSEARPGCPLCVAETEA